MMLDPLLTNVLRRRIGASFIDLGVVGLIAAIAAVLRAEKFTPQTTDPSTGEVIWSSADNARLNELSGDTLNRMAQLGDTQYIWSRDELIILALITVLSATLLFVLLPAISQSTIGQRMFHLRTSDLKGKPASTSQHFVRTAGGLLDLFPFVIPGALGWVVAARSNEKQRIGDRLAKTTVIDAKGAVRLLSEQELGQRQESGRSSGSSDDSMIDLGDRLGSPTQPEPGAPDDTINSETDSPHSLDGITLGMGFEGESLTAELPGVEGLSPSPTLPDSTTSHVGPPVSTHQAPIDHSWMTETPVHPDSPLSQTGWVPVTRDSESPLPESHSSEGFAAHSPERQSSGEETLANYVPDPSGLPVTSPGESVVNGPTGVSRDVGATDEAQSLPPRTPNLQPDLAPTPQEKPTVESKSAPQDASDSLPPPPLHRSTSWQQPKAEPAPVWTPQIEPLDPAPLQQISDETAIEGALQDEQRVSALTDLPNASFSEAPTALEDLAAARLTAQRSTDEATHLPVTAIPQTGHTTEWSTVAASHADSLDALTIATPGGIDPGNHVLDGGTAETSTSIAESDPRWDDDWQAWIYWDATHSAWLRHDIASDSWLPLG